MQITYRVFFSFIVLLSPIFLFAHSTGNSFEVRQGDHLIDIGYEFEIREGSATRFDFSLLDAENKSPEEYAHVWVRILKDDSTIFATGVHRASLGPTTLLYTFTDKDTYTLSASFRSDDEEIAAATMPVTVVAGEKTFPWEIIAALFLGMLVGAAAYFAFVRSAR
jgi:hypothetical protein